MGRTPDGAIIDVAGIARYEPAMSATPAASAGSPGERRMHELEAAADDS